jgi:hypothetical protein
VINLSTADPDAQQEAGYGIFAGPAVATAVIHFTPTPPAGSPTKSATPPNRNASSPTAPGLTIPYAYPRELLMDVQRYGADAEVIAPPELREQIRTT